MSKDLIGFTYRNPQLVKEVVDPQVLGDFLLAEPGPLELDLPELQMSALGPFGAVCSQPQP